MAGINLEFMELNTLDDVRISDVTKSISARGACLIRTRKNTSDYNLSQFSKKFGKIVMHPKSSLDGIVKIKSGENKTYLSQSNEEHPFHTDGTYLEEGNSIDLVALHCVKPCPDGGGLNKIMSGTDIFNHLKKIKQTSIIEILSENSVGFSRESQKSFRKIFKKENDKWKISFRLDSAGDITFPSKEVESAYNTLAKIIHNDVSYIEFGLREDEILLLDNSAYLHSRTNYSFNSHRLINRVQITDTAIDVGFEYE
ncbi:TauD/TfdA family dioxygenase [Xenorhabdus sp. KJ12.1]|uniref:TauD/TfdA family dioxygenase n=1 Tax=Xenorhabdus sp. KJ12.1 TaxID=1851571 RepID=UPI000C0625F1|nr:TauD/TfdA family dioxygenase [Xenorhabdus sp. KJ12.1]PHM72290.1 hypothetical protein Xekj_00568 [Xenorhabdus sp. KJ12.1]